MMSNLIANPPSNPGADQGSQCIGRQPILWRNGKIFGYEMLFRSVGAHSAPLNLDQGATIQVLNNLFSLFGYKQTLGEKLAFVNINERLLTHPEIFDFFPPEQLILEILESVEPTPANLSACNHLKKKGYRIALDDFVYSPEWNPFISIADFVKLDVMALDPEELRRSVGACRRDHLQLIAEKVETESDFDFCKELRFDLFQGYFFSRPTTLQTRNLKVSQIGIIQLLNSIGRQADAKEISEIIKQDVHLSYRLMCYVNSVWIGLRHSVSSIRQAVSLIGLTPLYRWLSMMLVYCGGETKAAAATMALMRGRMMETLGKSGSAFDMKDSDMSQRLFLTGAFSYLDALMDMPFEEILERLHLHPEIEKALTKREGSLGEYLRLIEAFDNDEGEELSRLSNRLNIGMDALNSAQFESMAWIEKLIV